VGSNRLLGDYTWTGDCLQTGKLVSVITNHPGQLSLTSLRGR